MGYQLSSSSVKNVLGGGSISDVDARELSRRLAMLGNEWPAICVEIDAAGYGTPSSTARAALERLAETVDDRKRLHIYWTEWAKERLAALAGPVNILRGRYPPSSGYRSEFIAVLRDAATAARARGDAQVLSPQIEPTLMRFVEQREGVSLLEIEQEVENARAQAAAAHQFEEVEKFRDANQARRYEMFIERCLVALGPVGFQIDSNLATGVVFRRQLSSAGLDFLLVHPFAGAIMAGNLSPIVALTVSTASIDPRLVDLSAVATFSLDDVIPRFRSSCMFNRLSYAQFCLAIDSITFLSKILYAKIDKLLAI